MANLVRSAKSGNSWTQSDLEAYNIRVVFQGAATFFNGPLPQPTVRPEILTVQDYADVTQDRDTRVFIKHLKYTTSYPEDHPASVVDFFWKLFQELKYEAGDTMLGTTEDFQYITCGQVRHVETDFFLLNTSTECIQLLAQQDKRHWFPGQPSAEPQLIAEAIAAFAKNNTIRAKALGLSPREGDMLPGFTMTGTFPVFYKIPVTTALVCAVEEGRYPLEETIVYAHCPKVPRPQRCFSEGMVPLDNRYIILSCFEALRQFIR